MQETLIKRELKGKGREIVLRARGSSHGPITRLVSPSGLGQSIKPFVFLDYGLHFLQRRRTGIPKPDT
jgi:hypothetical protein